MSDNATSVPDHRSCREREALDELEKLSPRRWIYRNLTPWRILACFASDGTLLTNRDRAGSEVQCEKCVGQVLSIPALGEVLVPAEDARHLNTLNMRRLGQIELGPAPSEILTNLPRAVAIFGWLTVGLVFGVWALFSGGGSALPWDWFVAAVVAVPVVALVIATAREVHLYRRFGAYRDMLYASGGGHPGHGSLEGVERAAGSGRSSTGRRAKRPRWPC